MRGGDASSRCSWIRERRDGSRCGHTAAVRATDVEGWVTLTVQFDHEDEACFVVLGLGSRVEVIEPVSLRDRVAVEVDKLIERRRMSGRAAINKPTTEN